MGGVGSGRHYHWNTKDTTEDYRTIDIRRWHSEKLLSFQKPFVWKWVRCGKTVSKIKVFVEEENIKLSYKCQNSEGIWIDYNYLINFTWTSCHFGGKRPWFICPAKYCGRRVAILYLKVTYTCRWCCDLVYASQRENLGYRALRGVDKVLDKIEQEPTNYNKYGCKPKGMHWQTLRRLHIKHGKYVRQIQEWEKLRYGSMSDFI